MWGTVTGVIKGDARSFYTMVRMSCYQEVLNHDRALAERLS